VVLFPVALAVLCFWATVPYGGVARWAWATIVAGIFVVGIIGFYASAMITPEKITIRFWEKGLWLLALGALFAWGIYQTQPQALSKVVEMQGGSEIYQTVFSTVETMDVHGPNTGEAELQTTISFDPVQSRLMLISWAAYAFLVWICARLVSRRIGLLTSICFAMAPTAGPTAFSCSRTTSGRPASTAPSPAPTPLAAFWRSPCR